MPIEQFDLDFIFDSEHPAARFAVDGALQLELCRSMLDLAEHLPGRLDREAIAYFLGSSYDLGGACNVSSGGGLPTVKAPVRG